jgi:hypothetical protein
MRGKQTRITPKPTNFVPRGPARRENQKTWPSDPAVVWVDREGNAYRMHEITDTHLVSIVSMMDRSSQNAIAEAEKRGVSITNDKKFIEHTDKLMQMMIELAVRGIPYSDVPRND